MRHALSRLQLRLRTPDFGAAPAPKVHIVRETPAMLNRVSKYRTPVPSRGDLVVLAR